jgi:hypothetical protein
VVGEKTYLTARCPSLGKHQLSAAGDYRGWGNREWRSFIEAATKMFPHCDVDGELQSLRIKIGCRRMLGESPVVDDDRGGERLEIVHTLKVHHSRSRGYVRIAGGGTFSRRAELRNLGFRWNPGARAWEMGYSDRMLDIARRFAEANDTPLDPVEAGYTRCPECARWIPEGSVCVCRVSES